MSLLIVSIAPTTFDELRALAGHAWTESADAVEVRLDRFTADGEAVAGFLREHPARRWIITCRSRAEGGWFAGSHNQRIEFLRSAVQGTDAAVDVELVDWQALDPTHRVALTQPGGGEGPSRTLILSRHEVEAAEIDVEGLLAEMASVPNSVKKVAFPSGHICDSFAALDAMHRSSGDRMVIATGEDGLWTRVLAAKLGAWGTYCALDAGEPTAPGQLTVMEMRERFGSGQIGASTRVYGVIGDPVAHSFGPLVFNHWFRQVRWDAVYLPLLVRRKGDCVRRFLDGCLNRPWLDLGGLSVTIPHKGTVLNWIGDGADSMSRSIGALNTLCFHDDGHATGFNTDCYAAVDSLADALGRPRAGLSGLTVDVLGTGGVARALLYGLQEMGARTTLFGRSADRTCRLAEEFHAAPRPWGDLPNRSGEVIINCTSVGLWPRVDESPLPPDAFRGAHLVFDLVYNPPRTRLLGDAQKAGVRTLNGLDMFVRQAAMQFELWTHQRPDLESARHRIRLAVEGPAPPPAAAAPQVPRRTVALIGMRGAGKTTVGRELADLLRGDFADTDDLISGEAGRTIATVFDDEGEGGFRRRERAIIARVTASPPAVIAVGGGAVLDSANVDDLRRSCVVVWLTAPSRVLWERVSSDRATAGTRPPLTSLNALDELEALSRRRADAYRRAADFVIDTAGLTPRQIAERIKRLAEV